MTLMMVILELYPQLPQCQATVYAKKHYIIFSMAEGHYMPQTKVDWTSNNASSQFKLWHKEVERIIGGPLAARADRVKLNHIYI